MARASDTQKAERLNLARTLLREHEHLPEAAEHLARDCSISRRQAYRYLEQAQQLKHPVPVGDAKVSFTVKLSRSLVDRLRDIRRFHRIDLERDRQPCLLGGTASRGRSWLTGRQVGNGRCGWNINLIDCCQRSWRRRMSCSCPPRSGRQPAPLPDKPAASRRF